MNQKQKQLLKELATNSCIMLKPSKIQGIGVFAIAPIKKGQRKIFSNDKSEWLKISRQEVKKLPKHSIALIENYCLFDEENYFVPEYGFKMVDLVIFLNHSDVPNISSINDGSDFEALRNIRAGEELLIDYGKIIEHT